jgi:hypothetical protein
MKLLIATSRMNYIVAHTANPAVRQKPGTSHSEYRALRRLDQERLLSG